MMHTLNKAEQKIRDGSLS